MIIFYEPKKCNIVKYTMSCRGINGAGASKSKKVIQNIVDYIYIYIYKKRSVVRSFTSVLYRGCMVPEG